MQPPLPQPGTSGASYAARDFNAMAALPPDYDADPERWTSWEAPEDVHEMVAPELRGPVLDVGCGEGRLASLIEVTWIGLDASPAQLAAIRIAPWFGRTWALCRFGTEHLPRWYTCGACTI
jgi:SAM-dependent methyltransferase